MKKEFEPICYPLNPDMNKKLPKTCWASCKYYNECITSQINNKKVNK